MKRNELIEKTGNLGKEVFTIKDLKKLFPGESNLKMAVKRLKDAGVIVSVARGMYFLQGKPLNIEKLANQIYYPSYISFESALATYGVINQGLYQITLATTRHSKKLKLAGTICEYIKIKESLFFGFTLVKGVYLAEPEKAFLDELYLLTLGKRPVNYGEWYLKELNKAKIKKYLGAYGHRVQEIAEELVGRA